MLCVLAAGLAGCPGAQNVPGVLQPDQPIVNPFAPTSIRVHPLTHLDIGDDGQPMIILHVELRDFWGEACKGVGSVVVELYRPSTGPRAGLEVQELVWEVNLTDLQRNARLYDPATRTYRLQLANLPNWISVDPNASTGRRVRLNVTLTAPDDKGNQIVLDDAYVLSY